MLAADMRRSQRLTRSVQQPPARPICSLLYHYIVIKIFTHSQFCGSIAIAIALTKLPVSKSFADKWPNNNVETISWNTCAKVKGSKRHLLQRGRGSKLHSSISTCMWSTGAETSACCELSAPGSFHFCYLIKCFTSIGGRKTSLNSSMSVIFSVCS